MKWKLLLMNTEINKAVEKEIVSKVMERRTTERWEAKQGMKRNSTRIYIRREIKYY